MHKYKEVNSKKEVRIIKATPDSQIEVIKPKKEIVKINKKRVAKVVFN